MRRLPHGAILVGALACVSATSARAETAPMGQSWALALEGCQVVPVTGTPAYGSAVLRKPTCTARRRAARSARSSPR